MTIDPDELVALLKEHLTIEVGALSTDPNDDTMSVSIWWGPTKITEANL